MKKIGLPGLLSQLFDDCMAVAKAEVRLAKSTALARIRAVRTGLILLAAALVVALAALIGLMVGIVLSLTALIGGAADGGLVLVVGLAVAAALAWAGWKQISNDPAATEKIS